MRPSELRNRLQQLALEGERRSLMARLRDVFDEVERALAAGVRQTVVLAELREAGISMTSASFKSALQRIRKERRVSVKPVALRTDPRTGSELGRTTEAPAGDVTFEYRPAEPGDESSLI